VTPTPASHRIAPGAFIVGACGIVVQVVLIRELLVTFQGNELVIGVILANWLLTEAAGAVAGERLARGKAPLAYYNWLLVFSAFAFPLVIIAGRGAALLLGVPQGAAWGFSELFLLSFFLLAPLGVPHGALFSLSCQLYPQKDGTARIYVLETAGTVFGALVLTFLLLWQVNTMAIAVYTTIFLLALAWLVAFPAKRLLTRYATPIFLLAMIISGAWLGAALDKSSLMLRFAEEVVFNQNSLHGNLTVTRAAEQVTFFYDGRFMASAPMPDLVLAEETAHFPLLAHHNPQKVLLLSGGLGGIIPEILKHPVQQLDYVEVDPLIWQAGKQFIPNWKTLLRDKRVRPLTGDARLLLQHGLGRYDVVLLGPLDPASLELNRLFSREFFELVRNNLNPGGIFAFSVPGSLVYLGPELLELNRVMYHTAKSVFARVHLIPGDRNLFLALTDEATGITAMDAVRRLTERRFDNKVVNCRLSKISLRGTTPDLG